MKKNDIVRINYEDPDGLAVSESGFLARLNKDPFEHDGIMIYDLNYSEFDSYNDRFASPIFFKGNDKTTAKEAGWYKSFEEHYITASDDIDQYLSVVPEDSLVHEWIADGYEPDYVKWLERQVPVSAYEETTTVREMDTKNLKAVMSKLLPEYRKALVGKNVTFKTHDPDIDTYYENGIQGKITKIWIEDLDDTGFTAEVDYSDFDEANKAFESADYNKYDENGVHSLVTARESVFYQPVERFVMNLRDNLFEKFELNERPDLFANWVSSGMGDYEEFLSKQVLENRKNLKNEERIEM